MNSTEPSFLRRRASWVLLLLAAWGIWLWQLNLADLSFDETATYFVAYRPPLEILSYLLGAAQEHPPLYYLLIRGWMALTGTGEFALRYFSLLVGMVVLVLVGWLARIVARGTRQSGLVLGLATAVLLTFTPAMAFYARNARMYSLVIVWAILSAGLLLRDWVDDDRRPRGTAVLALMLVNGLSLFTHYYLILWIAAQPLVLLAARRWRPLATWVLAHSIPALVGGAWLLLASGLQSTLGNVLADLALTLPNGRRVVLLLSEMVSSPLNRPHPWLLWLLLALLIGGVAILWRVQARRGVWLLLLLVVPFGLAWLLPRTPQARYLIYLLPFVALALAQTVTVLWKRFVGKRPFIAATLSLLVVGLLAWQLAQSGLNLVLTSAESRYGHTLQTVQALSRSGDELLFYGPWQVIPFHYYNPGNLPPITILPEQAPPLLDPVQAEPVLVNLLARAQRLWVTPTAVPNIDPDYFVWNWLRQHAHAVWWQDDYQLFLPPLTGEGVTADVNLLFGDELLLRQSRTEAGTIAAGEGVRVTLYWRTARLAAPQAVATLLLVDDNGRLWQSLDAPLPPGDGTQTLTQRSGLLVPPGAPPGEYQLRLRVVDGSGTLLPAAGEEMATLHTITVVEPTHAPVVTAVPGSPGGDFCSPDGATCLTLAKVEPGGVNFQPGYPLPLTLHWLAPDAAVPPLQVQLQIEPDPWLSLPGAAATPVLTQTLPLLPNYAVADWAAGRLVTQPHFLQLPPDIPPGRAQVTLAVVGEDGRFWTTLAGSDVLSLFLVVIEERPTLRRLPAGFEQIEVDFGAEVGLRGFRVSGSACPGGQVVVDYGWYARERPSAIYAVFNHLVTAEETPVAQVDGWPQGGRLLTTQWQPGEYIEDSFVLDIPAEVPPGPYTFFVGLYDAATGDRLSAVQAGQRLPADRVPLVVLTCDDE